MTLGQPPSNAGQDWAILVTSEFFVPGLAIDELILVNADDDSDIAPLSNGMVINLATVDTANFNVRATTVGTAGSVGFDLTGATTHSQSETIAPYALFGDSSGDFNAGAFALGQHTLVVTPYSDAGATGAAGTATTVHFEVIQASQMDFGDAPAPYPTLLARRLPC